MFINICSNLEMLSCKIFNTSCYGININLYLKEEEIETHRVNKVAMELIIELRPSDFQTGSFPTALCFICTR